MYNFFCTIAWIYNEKQKDLNICSGLHYQGLSMVGID